MKQAARGDVPHPATNEIYDEASHPWCPQDSAVYICCAGIIREGIPSTLNTTVSWFGALVIWSHNICNPGQGCLVFRFHNLKKDTAFDSIFKILFSMFVISISVLKLNF